MDLRLELPGAAWKTGHLRTCSYGYFLTILPHNQYKHVLSSHLWGFNLPYL